MGRMPDERRAREFGAELLRDLRRRRVRVVLSAEARKRLERDFGLDALDVLDMLDLEVEDATNRP